MTGCGTSSSAGSQSTEAEVKEAAVQDTQQKITDDSMSMGEKARAVFNYAHGKIGYSYNNYGGYYWQSEAYYALKDIEKSGYIGGDCFTYLIQNSYSNIKCIF